MKIYLDNCALGRLFDDQQQPRLRAEADAMRSVFSLVERGIVQWISSTALQTEIAQNSDTVRRRNTELLLARATETLHATSEIQARSVFLQSLGLTGVDAQHLAFAEAAAADALLTTDDRLIRRSARLLQQESVTASKVLSILNPIDWLRRAER